MKSGVRVFGRTFEVTKPYPAMRLFTLQEIGINVSDFVAEIAPTFEELQLDQYEKKREQIAFLKHLFPLDSERLDEFLPTCYCGQQTIEDHFPELLSRLDRTQRANYDRAGDVRYRAIAKFELMFEEERPVIRRVPAGSYIQKCGDKCDLRALPRVFSEASSTVTDSLNFQKFLLFIVNEIKKENPSAKQLTVTLHEVDMVAYEECPFELPDGIHHDGADYIVSAIPLIMENVVVPTSTIYDANRQKILETKLMIGQGLFHDDRLHWHSVSPLIATAKRGHRCTLGFDIKIEK